MNKCYLEIRIKIKTSELEGVALDYAVAKCEYDHLYPGANDQTDIAYRQRYSTEWAQAGPIIEREGINLIDASQFAGRPLWEARKYRSVHSASICRYGYSPLNAAMRCYVASRLGDEVEILDELI